MEARLIKVYSTTNANAAPVEVRFTGSTQGDLLRALGINESNVTVRGRQTRSEYPFTDSVLSHEDTFFFIGPKKMDSGLSDIIYDEINDLKAELMSRIEDVFDSLFEIVEDLSDAAEASNSSTCAECDQLKQEAKNLGF